MLRHILLISNRVDLHLQRSLLVEKEEWCSCFGNFLRSVNFPYFMCDPSEVRRNPLGLLRHDDPRWEPALYIVAYNPLWHIPLISNSVDHIRRLLVRKKENETVHLEIFCIPLIFRISCVIPRKCGATLWGCYGIWLTLRTVALHCCLQCVTAHPFRRVSHVIDSGGKKGGQSMPFDSHNLLHYRRRITHCPAIGGRGRLLRREKLCDIFAFPSFPQRALKMVPCAGPRSFRRRSK